MKTLLLTQPLPMAPFLAAVREHAPDGRFVAYAPDLSDAELADVEAVLAWQVPSGLAPRLPRLRWISSIAAGVEKLLPPDLPTHVRVSRIVDPDQAAGIAQFVVAMALRHVRSLPLYEAQQRERSWTRHPVSVVRHRVAVLGTGAMGGEIAAWLSRVGFDVQGWRRRDGRALHDVLATCEMAVCALPLTDATHGVLDARAFAAMPRGGYVINVARGAHIVEPDLIAAVASGHLTGASLDVQCTEPLPADDPLWTVPGITITPHIAAQSSPETIAAQFVAGLGCVQRGERPPQLVDRARGY